MNQPLPVANIGQNPASQSQSIHHYSRPMVSHAEVAEGSRRAPSVSSRSRSKHHHRGRSHAGGSSYTPQNEFPFFAQTGDVEILVACDGQEKKYLLHSLLLSQCSGFFAASTSDEWSRNQAVRNLPPASAFRPIHALTVIGEEDGAQPAAPIGTAEEVAQSAPSRRRWRYELDWENLEDDDDPILVQKVCSRGYKSGLSSNRCRHHKTMPSSHHLPRHSLVPNRQLPTQTPSFAQWPT